MGNNVISATLVGRKSDPTNSQDPNNLIEEDGNDASFWQIVETSIVEEMDEGENPYAGRKV